MDHTRARGALRRVLGVDTVRRNVLVSFAFLSASFVFAAAVGADEVGRTGTIARLEVVNGNADTFVASHGRLFVSNDDNALCLVAFSLSEKKFLRLF